MINDIIIYSTLNFFNISRGRNGFFGGGWGGTSPSPQQGFTSLTGTLRVKAPRLCTLQMTGCNTAGTEKRCTVCLYEGLEQKAWCSWAVLRPCSTSFNPVTFPCFWQLLLDPFWERSERHLAFLFVKKNERAAIFHDSMILLESPASLARTLSLCISLINTASNPAGGLHARDCHELMLTNSSVRFPVRCSG